MSHQDVIMLHSNIVTAYDDSAIGAKVLDRSTFDIILKTAISVHDFSEGPTPGQAVIDLMDIAVSLEQASALKESVSGGCGRKTKDPSDYVLRPYREGIHMFLRRELAEPVNFVRAVVYTVEGYLNDPDVKADPDETRRIITAGEWYPIDDDGSFPKSTHVLVAVLAGAIPSFVSPYRFVANLAGGNLDYAANKKTHADLVLLAKQVKEYDDNWATVAD